MVAIFFNYSIIFIIICSQIIIFISEGKTINANILSKITDEYINLAKFERPIMMVTNHTHACVKYPEYLNHSTSSVEELNVGANICHGSINNCRFFAGPENFKFAQYCMTSDRKELKWAVSTSRIWYGPSPLKRNCKNHIKISPDRQHCYYLCNCMGGNDDEFQDIWSFSLIEQQSNVAENKIVTGIQFVKINKTIHLQIKEATLQSNDSGIWCTSSIENSYENNTNIATLTYSRRSLHLGLTILPPHYVVTGVRFVKTNKKINMEIQGTKLNRKKNRLELKHQQWFTSDDAQRAYTKVIWTPPLNKFEIIKPISASIEFHPKNIKLDMGYHTYPHLYSGRIEMKNNHPIKAVRLSVVRTQHGETLVPQIAGSVKYLKLIAFPDS